MIQEITSVHDTKFCSIVFGLAYDIRTWRIGVQVAFCDEYSWIFYFGIEIGPAEFYVGIRNRQS